MPSDVAVERLLGDGLRRHPGAGAPPRVTLLGFRDEQRVPAGETPRSPSRRCTCTVTTPWWGR